MNPGQGMAARAVRRVRRCKDAMADRALEGAGQVLLGMRTLPLPLGRPAQRALVRGFCRSAYRWRDFPSLNAWEFAGSGGRALYVGRTGGMKRLRSLLFPDEAAGRPMGRVSGGQIAALVEDALRRGRVDLAVVESCHRFSLEGPDTVSFTVPTSVDQVLHFGGVPNQALAGSRNKTRRRRINRALRDGFSYRYSTRLQDFDRFYHEMYLPFVQSRHGDGAMVTPYGRQQGWFRRSGLLIVERQGQAVAGKLCHVAGRTCFGIESGVRGAEPALLQGGVLGYLHWAAIQWASARGAVCFNMGGSHPWCSNGSFRYKSSWGARVAERAWPNLEWSFLCHRLPVALARQMDAIGFITRMAGGFYRVYCAPMPYDAAGDAGRAAQKLGLNGAVFLRAFPPPVPAAGLQGNNILAQDFMQAAHI